MPDRVAGRSNIHAGIINMPDASLFALAGDAVVVMIVGVRLAWRGVAWLWIVAVVGFSRYVDDVDDVVPVGLATFLFWDAVDIVAEFEVPVEYVNVGEYSAAIARSANSCTVSLSESWESSVSVSSP